MKRFIEKYFIAPLGDYVANKVNLYIKQEAMKDMAWDVFSTLGLEELEKIIEDGNENRKKDGHTNYYNLGEIYAKRIKGITIKRLEEILRSLSEVNI